MKTRCRRAALGTPSPVGCLAYFRTAVPFWGQSTWSLTGLSPKWDCGSKGDKDGWWASDLDHIISKNLAGA